MAIKIEATNKEFSQFGGLTLAKELVHKGQFIKKLSSTLPVLKSGVKRSLAKAEQLILGFIAGAECLDDMDRFIKDPGVLQVFDKSAYTAKSHGNFLRSFSALQAKQLNYHMTDQAFALRQQIPGQNKKFILDLDSTENKQCGKKMEGYGKNYKGTMGLDTIVAFDELGFQYHSDVRSGGTYSSQQGETIIHEVFKRMPNTDFYKDTKRYFRGDSAFCNSAIMNACLAKNAQFTIAMKANIYNPLIPLVKDWKSQNKEDEERIKFYDNRECEIGSCLYYLKNIQKALQVVFIRAKKSDSDKVLLRTTEDYDYFASVTNIGEHEMSFDKIIKFYRERGQSENYIKELKYGFDLKHYPCQKLIANKAYASFAGIGANIIRFMAFYKDIQGPELKRKKKKKKPKIRFSKLARFSWILLPCQVVQHARKVEFRFNQKLFREVNYWIETIKTLQLEYT